jgi:hypothetical protein
MKRILPPYHVLKQRIQILVHIKNKKITRYPDSPGPPITIASEIDELARCILEKEDRDKHLLLVYAGYLVIEDMHELSVDDRNNALQMMREIEKRGHQNVSFEKAIEKYPKWLKNPKK